MTVTPPSPKESCWGPLSSEQGSAWGGGQGGWGPGGQRVRPGVLGALGDRGGHMSAGQGVSRRQLALLHLEHHHPGREAGGMRWPGPTPVCPAIVCKCCWCCRW